MNILLMLVAILAGLLPSGPLNADPEAPRLSSPLLLAKPRAEVEDTAEVMKEAGVRLYKSVPSIGLHILELLPGVQLADALALLRGSGLYEYVEPDSSLSIEPPIKPE